MRSVSILGGPAQTLWFSSPLYIEISSPGEPWEVGEAGASWVGDEPSDAGMISDAALLKSSISMARSSVALPPYTEPYWLLPPVSRLRAYMESA